LARKLGIKPGMKVFFNELPSAVLAELKPALTEAKLSRRLEPSLDFIHGFVRSKSELKKRLPIWKRHLAKSGCLWISWPKKSSGLETDLTEIAVREAGLSAALVDIKVCAVDEVWSGLTFVYRKSDR
jgi:hypothetical protein